MQVLPDPNHRAWNDASLSLKDSGYYGLIMLMVIVLNFEHGPWRDARWLGTMREGCDAYCRLASPSSCPVFQGLWPRIAHDLGENDMQGDSAFQQEVFDSLPQTFETLHEKVHMARWFGFVQAAKEFLPVWHKKLAILIYVAAQAGLLDGQGQAGALLQTTVLRSAEDIPKESTGVEQEQLRKIRQACKNTLQLVLVVLGDAEIRHEMGVVVKVLEPLWSWQGKQNKLLRSTEAALQWYTAQAVGSGFRHIEKIMMLFNDMSSLEELGFGVLPGGCALPSLDASHPLLLLESVRVAHMAKLILAVVGRRLWSNTFYDRNYPGMFAGLLDSSEGESVLKEMQADMQAWEECQVQGVGPFWKKIKERSPFKTRRVQQVCGGYPAQRP